MVKEIVHYPKDGEENKLYKRKRDWRKIQINRVQTTM